MGCFSCVGVCGMTDLVKRLREPLVSDAFGRHNIASSLLAERLICDRQDAAQAIEELTAALRDNQNKFAALCLNHSEDSIQYRILSRSAKLAAELVTKYAPKENG